MKLTRHRILAVLLGVAPIAPAADQPWFQRSPVGLDVGPTGSQFGGSTQDAGFATRFNGRDIARATDLKKRGNKVTLRVEDIHEVVTLNY